MPPVVFELHLGSCSWSCWAGQLSHFSADTLLGPKSEEYVFCFAFRPERSLCNYDLIV